MNRAACSAVFSDGSFCYIPKGTTCPMEISTYFRINNQARGCLAACADGWGFRAPQPHRSLDSLSAPCSSQTRAAMSRTWRDAPRAPYMDQPIVEGLLKLGTRVSYVAHVADGLGGSMLDSMCRMYPSELGVLEKS